jgi:hypothetical protein
MGGGGQGAYSNGGFGSWQPQYGYQPRYTSYQPMTNRAPMTQTPSMSNGTFGSQGFASNANNGITGSMGLPTQSAPVPAPVSIGTAAMPAKPASAAPMGTNPGGYPDPRTVMPAQQPTIDNSILHNPNATLASTPNNGVTGSMGLGSTEPSLGRPTAARSPSSK